MTADPTVLIHPTAEVLAEAATARLVTTLVDVQSTGRVPRWVLTGGSIADRIHQTVARSPARHAVDWSRVDFWWGDERFVAAEDEQRNDLRARELMLDSLPVDPRRVHPMPAATADDDPDAAAAAYADELSRAASTAEDPGPVPVFDVVMLGVGPDGHVASLFPGRPELHDERPVTAIRDSPKPPPIRLTLTMTSLRTSREVWCVVSGDDKAEAVRLALTDAEVPAAGPQGRARTLWFLDAAAAAQLPPGMAP